MAYKDLAHRESVFRTHQYRRMVSEWAANKAPVPLSVFQDAYGKAFWDRRGNSEEPGRTETSRTAFLNIMIWTGRAPTGTTWDEWEKRTDFPGDTP